MDTSNDNSKSLLKMVYNCKTNEFESMLERIENELRKNKNDQDALNAKLVLTSKMAVKRIDSK
ncbi:MAG TPA: hypothetical protein PLC38_05205 [Methanobacterium sp.]|nr:MAG: hypothetical protein FGO69_10660 [Methanobacterium sp.]HOI71666.1 hypothetical protein [Methanobacterium sp.]